VTPVFIDGALDRTLRGDHIVAEFQAILDQYVERRFPASGAQARG
jgi:(E)-4-hydroxy-3-methylbut-2-enyl-diphosphate synthase